MPQPRIEFQAIRAKLPIAVANAAQVVRELNKLGLNVVAKAADYPTQESDSYRRKGTLGKGWTKDGPKRIGRDLVVDVGNNTEYTVFVMGPEEDGQLEHMRDLGWKSIEEIGQEQLERSMPDLIRALDGD